MRLQITTSKKRAAQNLVQVSISPMLSVVVNDLRGLFVFLAQRRNISSLLHVDVTVRPHGIFHLVVSLLSIIRKRGDVEALVAFEAVRSKAFVHYLVSRFEIRWRPLLVWARRMLDGGRIANEVGSVQLILAFVLRVEALQTAAPHHISRMLLDVSQMHLFEELVLLLARVLIAHPDAIELVGEPHLVDEILRRPVSGQDVEDSAVTRQHKHLDVVRSGAVRSHNRIAEIIMPTGFTGVRLIGNVFGSANEVVLEGGEGWFLRERHGSQAVTGTSRCAAHAAQHMDPEDHFALFSGALLNLPQRLVPVEFGRHGGDAVVRGLTAEVCRLPRLSGHEKRHEGG